MMLYYLILHYIMFSFNEPYLNSSWNKSAAIGPLFQRPLSGVRKNSDVQTEITSRDAKYAKPTVLVYKNLQGGTPPVMFVGL